MSRSLVPVAALLSVGALAAWWFAPAPRVAAGPAPAERAAPSADEATPPRPEPLHLRPPPARPPVAAAPPLPIAAGHRLLAPGRLLPSLLAAARAPALAAASDDSGPSPFAAEAMPEQAGALQQAARLADSGRAVEAARLLADRAEHSAASDHDRLLLIAARTLLDHGEPERARALLAERAPRDPALADERATLEARLRRPPAPATSAP